MRVIAEVSLQMSGKDAEGLHHVKDRYCPEMFSCFSFNCDGVKGVSCPRFKRLPTGVKICLDEGGL